MTEKTIYINAPSYCSHCSSEFDDTMFDAKTVFGYWGNLCRPCFEEFGVGLGTGRGQEYKLNEGKWVKVNG
jgi:hypothetical protein